MDDKNHFFFGGGTLSRSILLRKSMTGVCAKAVPFTTPSKESRTGEPFLLPFCPSRFCVASSPKLATKNTAWIRSKTEAQPRNLGRRRGDGGDGGGEEEEEEEEEEDEGILMATQISSKETNLLIRLACLLPFDYPGHSSRQSRRRRL